MPFDELIQHWKYCDEAGYDCLYVADHFAHWNKPLEPFWECWSLLSAIASNTSKIRLGPLITNMSWRHPAWLAKQILALDHLSNGRLNIGLGSGRHNTIDQKWILADDWTNKERVERFREYVEVIDLLLRNPVSSYTGKYYQLKDAPLSPECVQQPRPPILIGTKGKKMLKTVARFADAWNCLAVFDKNLEDKSFDDIKEKNKLLDHYCQEIGRNPDEIQRSVAIYESNALQTLSPIEFYDSPDLLMEIIDNYSKIGFTEIILTHPLYKKETLKFERFTKEILSDK